MHVAFGIPQPSVALRSPEQVARGVEWCRAVQADRGEQSGDSRAAKISILRREMAACGPASWL